MRSAVVAAVDLGASPGRVGPGRVELSQAHRFANRPVPVGGTLYWDSLGLYRDVLDGLRAAGRAADRIDSVGIDTWAVDYGLLDASGVLLGNPVHYRDGRTARVLDKVLAEIPAPDLYEVTGMALLPFNTVFQLAATAVTPQLAAARRLLLLPDLLAYCSPAPNARRSPTPPLPSCSTPAAAPGQTA